MIITKESLLAALNERDLFNNPDVLIEHADYVDCGGADCPNMHREDGTNVATCGSLFCPNDLAETLRALAALARRDGE
jgi:hypothetical protein